MLHWHALCLDGLVLHRDPCALWCGVHPLHAAPPTLCPCLELQVWLSFLVHAVRLCILQVLAGSTAMCSAGVWLHALVGYLWHLPCWQASLQLYTLLCLRQAALLALCCDEWDCASALALTFKTPFLWPQMLRTGAE
jgi:hypothetical protein